MTHNKMYANLAGVYPVSGFRNGTPVAATERLSSTFQDLAMSHGMNTWTIGPVYRLSLCEDDCGVSRVQPYVGLGVGVAVPHVEVTLAGTPGDEKYRLGGIAYQAQAGVNFRITDYCSIFAEFKVTCVPNLDVDIFGGSLTHAGD